MSRPQSAVKGGYYPTPDEEVSLVCSRLRIEHDSPAYLLDPCCGKGEALRKMAGTLKKHNPNVVSYGIELERTRAEAAKKVLDNAICSAYEDALVSPKAFSFLWLNPPYDERGRGIRFEVDFLRNLTDSQSGKLQPGGVLGYCIPLKVLGDAANLLAVRFDNLRVYLFTAENFPLYKQIVVFGCRREKPDVKESHEKAQILKAISTGAIRARYLDEEDGVVYNVPPAQREVDHFKGNELEPEEFINAINHSPAWNDFLGMLPKASRVSMKPPVMPLKSTHTAVAIAAGAIGGNMGNHLLTGKTEKVVDVQVIPGEDSTTEIQTERLVTAVRIFHQGGVTELK